MVSSELAILVGDKAQGQSSRKHTQRSGLIASIYRLKEWQAQSRRMAIVPEGHGQGPWTHCLHASQRSTTFSPQPIFVAISTWEQRSKTNLAASCKKSFHP